MVRIESDSWNIITRVIRRYPDNKAELDMVNDGSAYSLRVSVEVSAVEIALSQMSGEEREVIKERFWKDKSRTVAYERIYDTGYSPRQMRRIARRMIWLVGKELGEIK